MNIWEATDEQIARYKERLIYTAIATSKTTLYGWLQLAEHEADRKRSRQLVEAWLKKAK